MRVKGMFACFSRPELKVERISYAVPTPSAVCGIYSAILWKPAIRWYVRKIHVCKPIQFVAFRRNEVNSIAPNPAAKTIAKGGPAPLFFADEDRAQRNTVALYDVEYVFESFFTLTEDAGESDNVTKFVDMFQRRLEKGQCFSAPYLGCREFAAEFCPADDPIQPIEDSRDLGLMLWGISFTPTGNTAQFFRAKLDNGTVYVPESPRDESPREEGISS
jgi:CRISPR-associated protein Cas5d